MNGRLLDAFGLAEGGVCAVVGAGGKTSLIHGLAAQALARGMTVLVTTTTHMGLPPEPHAGPILFDDRPGGVDEATLRRGLADGHHVTLLRRAVRADKLEGVAPERVDAVSRLADLVLVEADGARQRSLKLPADHEPVVPSRSALVVVVTALDVLGAELDERRVHRLERVRAALGRTSGRVGEDDVVSCLRHPSGYLSRLPPSARAAVFLNKMEDPAAEQAAFRIAPRLAPPYALVVGGSAHAGTGRVLSSLA